MSSFLEYKKNRAKSFESLTEEVSKIDQKESFDDARFWYPKKDSDKNAYAVIRFLPCVPQETAPYVRYWYHSFKYAGKWYIENSRTTLGEDDPMSKFNTELWESGTKENKDRASAQKRKLTFVSNILVIGDPANPENEGKVFLMNYGKKIFDKIKDKMNPAFKDEAKINPFDLFEGANFKLKVRQVEGYANYDKSEFMEPAPLYTDEKKMEAVFNQIIPLAEFTDPKQFKSYEDLEKRMNIVFKLGNQSDAVKEKVAVESAPAAKIKETAAPAEPAKNAKEAKTAEPAIGVLDEDEDDDSLAFFQNLTKS
jgi:hypothetical protein